MFEIFQACSVQISPIVAFRSPLGIPEALFAGIARETQTKTPGGFLPKISGRIKQQYAKTTGTANRSAT